MHSSIMTIDQTAVVCIMFLCITVICITFLRLCCKHKWNLEREIPVVNEQNKVIYRQFISRCTKCGKLYKDEL